MSAIRPGLPQSLPTPVGEAPSARNAQAAFFRTALNQVQAAQVQTTPIQVQAQTTAANPTRTVAPAPADGETPRIMRPGTYLDIKV
jgi:hypothetical protein